MISLTRAQRAALLFVSASAYLAWFSGFGERLEAQGLAGAPAPSLTVVPRAAPPRVSTVIARDPFAGSPFGGAAGDVPPPAAPPPTAARVPADSNGTVPNISARGGDFALAAVPDIANGRDTGGPSTLVVRATIVGRNPVAYVANGSMMDIVRVGDRLGDRRIGTIDIRGIGFSDGTRLDLPGAFEPTPRPQKTGAAVTIKLDDLRKLLLRPTRQSPPLAPGAGSVAGATPAAVIPAPAGTFPSPGPLPTIDARGIPVGTNPTPNANGPTPYPNPYPYAPPAPPHR